MMSVQPHLAHILTGKLKKSIEYCPYTVVFPLELKKQALGSKFLVTAKVGSGKL